MPATQDQETCTKDLHEKLALNKFAWKIWHKFVITTTDRPITLHGSCHVSDSFCAGI